MPLQGCMRFGAPRRLCTSGVWMRGFAGADQSQQVGIVILIEGSILPGLWYGFQQERGLMAAYMGEKRTCSQSSTTFKADDPVLILIAGLGAAYVVLSPRGRSHRWTRTLTFIALGLSAVVPVLHIIALYGFDHARQKFSLDLLIAGGASYIAGALL